MSTENQYHAQAPGWFSVITGNRDARRVVEAGITIPVPDATVLAHHQERSLTDRHFYKAVAKQQLKRWSDSGIQRADVDAALSVSRATKYQLDTLNGRLYRSEKCMFSMRCKGVEYFLARALPTLKRRNRAGKKDIVELSIRYRVYVSSALPSGVAYSVQVIWQC
jgi:hypothetical protein